MTEIPKLVEKLNAAMKEEITTIIQKSSASGRTKFLTNDDENAELECHFALEDDDEDSLYFELHFSSKTYEYTPDDSGKFDVARGFYERQLETALSQLNEDLKSEMDEKFPEIFVSIYVNQKMV